MAETDMANVWQQAEHNTGSLDELRRLIERVRDSLIAAPAEKGVPTPALRAGILGVLDGQAQEITNMNHVVASLLDYVGERGVAPVPLTGPMSGTTAPRW